jgi:hypothetical protein
LSAAPLLLFQHFNTPFYGNLSTRKMDDWQAYGLKRQAFEAVFTEVCFSRLD